MPLCSRHIGKLRDDIFAISPAFQIGSGQQQIFVVSNAFFCFLVMSNNCEYFPAVVIAHGVTVSFEL